MAADTQASPDTVETTAVTATETADDHVTAVANSSLEPES